MRLGTVEQNLELAQVRVDNTLNPRQGALDQDVVFDYSAHVDDLPPMAAFEIGGEYLLVSGFHRYAAHQLAGRSGGRFVVHQGTREEAKEFADLDNLKHGKNLTRAERREVIRRQLGRHPNWSDVRLALACCTSDKTVRIIREEMERTSEIPRLEALVGTDGIERPRTAPRPVPQPQPPAPELFTPVEELEGRYEITSRPTVELAPWEMTQAQAAVGLARLEADLRVVPASTEGDDAGEDMPDETGDGEVKNATENQMAGSAELDVEEFSGQTPAGMGDVPEQLLPAPDPGPPPPPPPLPPPPVVVDAPWQVTLTVRGDASPLLMLMRGGAMEKYLPENVARRVIAVVEAAIEPAAEWLAVSNQ